MNRSLRIICPYVSDGPSIFEISAGEDLGRNLYRSLNNRLDIILILLRRKKSIATCRCLEKSPIF